MSDRVFVIAEAGSCHDGQLDKAYRLIKAAKACDADAVKFQMCTNPERMAERRNAPELASIYRKYLHPVVEWLPTLKAKCDEVGIEFMCTTYLPEDICIINPYVKRFKISSFENEDQAFFDAHLHFEKPIIISWGMRNLHDILMVPDHAEVCFLHCVSSYPCPIDQLNLNGMHYNPHAEWRKRALRWSAGLSDHTTSWVTGGFAAAAGAKVIEKHICLVSTDPKNPDVGHSLLADGADRIGNTFRKYVWLIREAEKAMGDGVKRIMPAEEAMCRYKVK